MEQKEIPQFLRACLLLVLAVLLLVLLGRYHAILSNRGISIKQAYYFPIAVIAAVCYLVYSSVRILRRIFRKTP